ncbi:hypothetical protein DCAR_0832540 [Daucus carota subsp. sativus]|uniref:Uncharacterized protein n=1 Tax=Daucus carota subsp. sativus TaxID=79200 RepID=A0A175YQ15_DAUCS|nr:hypothetical protein DCAR_0832540 [Daucus carota subsp. sativus]
MAFDSTSKAVAKEAWSELVHSLLSWTPSTDMSMVYYYTIPEDHSNRLDLYKYKLGTENIEARIKSGLHSQLVQPNYQGIEHIRDCIRSSNGNYVVKAGEREDEQGIEYVRVCVRSTNDYHDVEVSEGENQLGISDIQPCVRSTNRYSAVQVDEQGNQLLMNRITYELVKIMATLFDDLFNFIESYNMHGVEKPTLRFQVLELIKLLHHYGSDTIRSAVEEELEYVNEKNSATQYKKALEVMLRVCDTGISQSIFYEIIEKAETDQVLYEW